MNGCGGLKVGPSTVVSTAVTGEEYIERIFYTLPTADAEDVVCKAAWEFFVADIGTRSLLDRWVLYWRTKPEFCYYENDENHDVDGQPKMTKGARLYMRYLISCRGQ